jgi:hypothetical protein
LLKTTQHFVQAIEGPRSAINKLYNKITSDSRHGTVTILKYQPIQERSFAKWSMALLTNKDINQKILSKLNLRTDFDPYRLNDLSAHSLLSFASQES